MIAGIFAFLLVAALMAGVYQGLVPVIGEEDAHGIAMIMTLIPIIPLAIVFAVWWCLEQLFEYWFSPLENEEPYARSTKNIPYSNIAFYPSRFQWAAYSPEGLSRLAGREIRRREKNVERSRMRY